MPIYENSPVRIHNQEAGTGFPLLVIPGGGLNATIDYLSERVPFNPMDVLSDEYHCITMDLRNANGGGSSAPVDVERPLRAGCRDRCPAPSTPDRPGRPRRIARELRAPA